MAHAILIGRAGSPGVGVGRLLRIDLHRQTAAAPRADVPPSGERERLLEALDAAASQLETLAAQTAKRAGEEIGAIFEAQGLFARDPGIVDPALALVEAGVPADVAITRASDDQADQLAAVDDDYFRERSADVRDVGRRVAELLRGEARPDLWHPDGHPAIVVAGDLDPSAVATVRPELVAGIALAGGAPTGHAAIVARALGIPLVLGLGSAIADIEGTNGAVDGTGGRLLVDPTEADLAALATVRHAVPAVPVAVTHHHGIAIMANVGSALEAEAAASAGAEGVGLVRTELLFLGRNAPPSVGEQRASYARIRAAMGDRPVVFRTLDIGGDKPTAWQVGAAEANPALGVRGLRLGLARPDLLDDQLTALLEASGGAELRVMLPMVATREELDAARGRLAAVAERLAVEDRERPSSIALGVMIEVPAAALMADALAEAADFFSIGTNDLVQYTMAADRTNAELADLASPLQPAVLRSIAGVVRAARARGRHVAVCGEAAADAEVIPLLVGLGVEELSVTPSSVAAVRARVAQLDPVACRDLAERALAAGTLADVRALVAG